LEFFLRRTDHLANQCFEHVPVVLFCCNKEE
jgi:hypothetical protein